MNFPFEKEPTDIKQKVTGYWGRRSGSFAEHKHKEAHSEKKELWQQEFSRYFSHEKPLDILDAGCGAGFFEMVLSPLGHNITGIDLTPEMVEEGQKLLSRHGVYAPLHVMDAEEPDFPEESFDVIVSRNLVWTLPHPAEAYARWKRLLRPGGRLLVFDAEYAKGYHKYDQSQNCSHLMLDDEMKEECHRIYHMLSISALDRPDWDVRALQELGYSEVMADDLVWDRLYASQDDFYMPDRMFSVTAVKK